MKTQLRTDFEDWMASIYDNADEFNNYNGFNFDRADADGRYIVSIVQNMWEAYSESFTKYAGDQFMHYDEVNTEGRPNPDIPDRGDQF